MIVKDDQRHISAIEVPASLLSRVRSEYLEMPGLRLTTWQAARLWGLDMDLSERVLTRLAQSGFLWLTREGAYVQRSAR